MKTFEAAARRCFSLILMLAVLIQSGFASATTMVRGWEERWSVSDLADQYAYRYGVLKDGAISASFGHVLGVKKDGTVCAAGDNTYGQCDVSSWKDIVAVWAASTFSLGLRADGTVAAAGDNRFGQCNVSDWTNIIAISASSMNAVGLRADGTVVVAGSDLFGQCSVQEWENIVAVAMTSMQTLGLKEDGTVVMTEADPQGWENGEEEPYEGAAEYSESFFELEYETDGSEPWEQGLSTWNHITAIACGGSHVIGLCEDGTVRAFGETSNDQVMVDEWQDVTAIAAGAAASVGWNRDGSFSTTYVLPQSGDWQDVTTVAYTDSHFIGLKQDGTVIFSADPLFGSALEEKADEITGWRDIGRSDCTFTFE